MLGLAIFSYLAVATLYWTWLRAGYADRHGRVDMRRSAFLYGRAMGWPYDIARAVWKAYR